MEMLGPFQVLPLKMLVTRQVIRERMQYKDFLGGIAKDELDRLDWIGLRASLSFTLLRWRLGEKAKY